MKKTIVFVKHIHSSNASVSSGDEWIYFETKEKLDFEPEENWLITSEKFPLINNERITEFCRDKHFMVVYLKSDEKFHYGYRIGDHHNNNPAFKELVESYIVKGFTKDKPESLNEYRNREKEREKKRARKAGLVLWMDFDEYRNNPEMYQGGFSNEVFKSAKLYNYVKRGCAYGWIGHSGARTAILDKHIENGLRKRGISPSMMGSWITSGDGRHFGDSLEGLSKKEQKEKIDLRLNGMYNSCLIYDAPSHGGMFTDSVRIGDVFQKFGILLPSEKKYNRKKHVEALMLAKSELSKIKKLSKDEEYISDIINEIFSNQV